MADLVTSMPVAVVEPGDSLAWMAADLGVVERLVVLFFPVLIRQYC